ncbi:MAG: four helix bundle protein [Planctomycetes bacterium]|nr:four helix bundle protein [Planctomycetota bacterium]
MEIKSFRDLVVWQKAMNFVVEIYRATGSFPGDERFGLTSQLRKSAVSVPSNIAEGHGRESTREFLNFLSIAYGSLNEAQTQIMIAEQLGFLPSEKAALLLELAGEVAKLTNGLCRSLKARLG